MDEKEKKLIKTQIDNVRGTMDQVIELMKEITSDLDFLSNLFT